MNTISKCTITFELYSYEIAGANADVDAKEDFTVGMNGAIYIPPIGSILEWNESRYVVERVFQSLIPDVNDNINGWLLSIRVYARIAG